MSTNASLQILTATRITLRARLTTSDGEPLFGMEIKFYRSTDKQTWSYIGSSYTNENGEASIATEAYTGEYFKAVFEGTEDYEPSEATAQYTAPAPVIELISETRKIWKTIAILGVIVILLLMDRRR